MGLPWIRLDTQLADHPKILELVADNQFRAIAVFHFGLGYCGKHETAGYIPAAALPFIHARKADATRLVNVSLWLVAPGGWQIKDWDDYQLSDEAAKKRRERAMKGAAARWGKKGGDEGGASLSAI
ncbi:hypothetical protein [Mycobacteroides immunogenum]|uniref:Uncharacterized protein n=1 Tax=Mycobacteroides immunogenum TaxID=83262 RepID=A0A7V8LRS8_9MYCO|nr:hypothetical protein [Mycobacteroides immunogenum]AMT70495.1 hypothetical protein ABG82_09305 [Mycobacteroides immunogenum]ANO03567.1 hypothetical protein BAB75_09365 [Mycobacteroides immunogenum]KIU41974.1 hypothetical protein TL11_02280 [Mycobacteroides immunogenum]KPG13583.1 hypothetical protein AN909_04635 [Mycobacteroides immunogenum]KPG14496.1 hypothetical protein AN908_08230 [Mycobacteroides immunogenum]